MKTALEVSVISRIAQKMVKHGALFRAFQVNINDGKNEGDLFYNWIFCQVYTDLDVGKL